MRAHSLPNILLVVLDTARADVIDPYGASPGSTPTLAALARSGQAIDARSTACWTVPSHVSMLAGLLHRTAALPADGRRPVDFKPSVESLSPRMLSTVLASVGYRTIGVSTNTWVGPHSGFASAFDSFHSVTGSRGGRFPKNLRQQVRWDREAVRAHRDDGAERAFATLTSELDADSDRPWFAFVNLVECHSPYLPPRPWNDLPAWRRLRAGKLARRYQTFAAFTKACLVGTDIPPDDLALMRHLYGRAVALLDDWMARVLGILDERRQLDDTIVVATSDHGENFGEGGLLGHSFSLDDRLLRVPLVVSGPGHERIAAGGGLFSLADLPAGLADAVGIDVHPWRRGEAGHGGVTVAQFDAPTSPNDEAAIEARETFGLDDAGFARMTTSFTAASDGRRKLVRSAGVEQIIDLTTDPLELSPMPVPTGGAELSSLRAALDAADAAERAPVTTPPSNGPDASDDELTAIEDQMRLLGYLD